LEGNSACHLVQPHTQSRAKFKGHWVAEDLVLTADILAMIVIMETVIRKTSYMLVYCYHYYF